MPKPIMKPFRWIFFPCRILLSQGKTKDFMLGCHISRSTFDVRADRIIHSSRNNAGCSCSEAWSRARPYCFLNLALTVTLRAMRERER